MKQNHPLPLNLEKSRFYTGWRTSNRTGKQKAVKFSLKKESHSGKYSAYCKGTIVKKRNGGWLQYLTLNPDTTYKVSAWIKTRNVEKGWLLHISMSTKGKSSANKRTYDKRLSALKGSRDWTYYEMTFITPKEPMEKESCFVYPFLLDGRGEVWIDDIKVLQMNDDEIDNDNLVENFSFEEIDVKGNPTAIKVIDFLKQARGFESGMKTAVSTNNRRWTVEITIPFAAFKETVSTPKIMDEWRFALCRINYSNDIPREVSSSALGRSFHHTEDYQILVFTN